MKLRRLTLVICLLFLVSMLASGSTTASLIESLPVRQQYQVQIITPLGEEEYRYFVDYQVLEDAQQLQVTIDGSGYISTTFYDHRLNLIQGEMEVIDTEDIARVGFDRRVAIAIPEKEQIILEFYLAEDLQLSRELYPPNNNATEIGILGLYLQALLHKSGIANLEFHGNLFDINRGSYFKLGTSLLTDAEVEKLAAGLRVPQQVKAILSDPNQIFVFKLGYTGIVRWFIPNQFYVVLEKAAPHRILAFWGGSSKLLRYEIYSCPEH